METIFDYNLTEGELKRFNIMNSHLATMVKNTYLTSSDDNFYALGLLFAMRNNFVKANEYWNKVEDKSMLDTLIEDF